MKTILLLATVALTTALSLAAQDKFTVSGTPIPAALLKQNYGTMPKGVTAYDLSICNATAERQAMVSSQIYQALMASNLAVKPIGRQIVLAAILQNERRSLMTILTAVLSSATGTFAILSTSKTLNVPTSAMTAVGLASVMLGTVATSLQPVLPADKLQKFDSEVLEPALVLDGGSCVERTLFAVADTPAAKAANLSFRVR